MKNILLSIITFSIFLNAKAQWKKSYGNMPTFSPNLSLCFQSSGEQLGPKSIKWHLLQSLDYGITFKEVLSDTSNALFSRGYKIINDSNIYAYAPFTSQIYHYKFPNYKVTDTINISSIALAQCAGCSNLSSYLTRFIPLFVNNDTTIIILGKTWISTNKGTQRQFVPYNNMNFDISLAGYYTSPNFRQIAIAGRTNGINTKIFHSNDYGKTWIDSIPLPSYISNIRFRNIDTLYATDADLVEKLYYSTDGGRNWAVKFDIKTTKGIISSNGRRIFEYYFTDPNRGILVLNGDTNIYSTINGGISWKTQTIDPPLENNNGIQETPQDFVFINDTLMYFTSSFYNTYRTGNKGGDVFVGVKMNNEKSENSLFSLYPNPAHKELTIRFENELYNNLTYSISNTLGLALYKGKMNNKETVIDVSKFIKGIYFMSLGHQVKKFIID